MTNTLLVLFFLWVCYSRHNDFPYFFLSNYSWFTIWTLSSVFNVWGMWVFCYASVEILPLLLIMFISRNFERFTSIVKFFWAWKLFKFWKIMSCWFSCLLLTALAYILVILMSDKIADKGSLIEQPSTCFKVRSSLKQSSSNR